MCYFYNVWEKWLEDASTWDFKLRLRIKLNEIDDKINKNEI